VLLKKVLIQQKLHCEFAIFDVHVRKQDFFELLELGPEATFQKLLQKGYKTTKVIDFRNHILNKTQNWFSLRGLFLKNLLQFVHKRRSLSTIVRDFDFYRFV
jgi:hypothetical protein